MWSTVPSFRAPKGLRAELPELLWLYQMGLVLFWVHDRSAQAVATRLVVARTVPIVVRAIEVSRLPALRDCSTTCRPCSPTCARSLRRPPDRQDRVEPEGEQLQCLRVDGLLPRRRRRR